MGDQALTNQPIKPDLVAFGEASPEQRELAWRLNGAAWASPMSIDDYVSRENYLSDQLQSRGGRCRYWVLYHKDDPLHIVASCESTKKTVLIAGGGMGSREGSGYAIASVYTNPKYRRLGMAALMLKELQKVMDKDGDCSTLYSDIGKLYYQSLGWPCFPSDQATLFHMPATTAADATADRFQVSQPGKTRLIGKEELQPLCDRDVADLRRRFDALRDDAAIHVAFAPDYPQVAWQLAREEFMAKVLYKKEVRHRGAITDDARAWIYWDHDWKAQTLKVQRIATPEPRSADDRAADITALLEAAMEEAIAWGLPKVLVWNPDDVTTRGVKDVGNNHESDVKIIFDERAESSIPSFRWKGGRDVSSTIWEDNYYYCWC